MAQVNGWTPVEDDKAPQGWTPVEPSKAQQDIATSKAAISLPFGAATKKPAIQRGVQSFNEGFGISPETKVSDVPKGLKLAITDPKLLRDSLKTMYLSASEAQQKTIDEAYQLQHLPGIQNKVNGFIVGVYSAIPLFGPAMKDADEKLQSGDFAGAFGSLAAIGVQLMSGRAGKAKVAEAPTGEAIAGPEGETVGAPGKMGEIKGPKSQHLRRLAQQITGSGPESTTEPMIQRYREKVKDAAEKQTEETAKTEEINRSKTEKGFREAGEKKVAYSKAVAEQEADVKAAKEKAEAEYQAAKSKITATNEAEKAKAEKRLQLTRDRDIESAQLNQDVQKLEKDVRAKASAGFNEVRDAVKGKTADSSPLIESVQGARKEILANYPDGVKEFDVIMGLKGNAEEMSSLRNQFSEGLGFGSDYNALSPERKKFIDDRVAVDQQRLGGETTENKPIDWNSAQALKSHIEAKLRNRTTPPQIKRALYEVRDTLVDKVMNSIVESAGDPQLKTKWAGARDFWKQYREDFSTPQGPSGSGSPVARALDADPRDPYSTRQPFLAQSVESTIGNRGVDILRKYKEFGGDKVADRVQKIVAQTRETEGLPKTAKLKEPPTGPKSVTEPKPIEKPNPVEVEYSKTKQVKKPAPVSVEGVIAAKQNKLRDAVNSWGKFHTYDLGILASSGVGALFLGRWEGLLIDPAFVAARKSFALAIRPEKVRAWIARPLPEEIKAIESAPRDVQDEWRGDLKSFVAQNPDVKIHPSVAAWLAVSRPAGPKTKQLQELRESQPDSQQ